MSRNEELIGVFVATRQVFDNGPDRRCVIGSIRLMDRKEATIKGYASETDLIEGVTYRFYGHFRNHPKFGRQFNFNSMVEEMPVDEESFIAYLSQCRRPEHGSISRRVAIALYEEFGLQAIDKVIADPVGAAENIKQWGAEKAGIASQYLKTQEGTRRCKLDLIRMLDGRRFPKKTIDRCIKEWGAKATVAIRSDPYCLMDLPGIGFKGADKLYCDLARETSSTDEQYAEKLSAIKRQGLCAWYEVTCQCRSEGSTWVPLGIAKAAVSRTIGSVRAKPDDAIAWAVGKGLFSVREGFVAPFRMALHELEIAEFVTSSDEGTGWPSVEDIAKYAPPDKPLSEHQLDSLFAATRKRIGCLQGSPGTGKTFSTACVIKAIIAKYGEESIAAAAPTGKAGVRMTQSLKANGVSLQASTIHRLLQVESEGRDGWSFHFNEQNPLPYRFIIADEFSMCDVDLLASLLRACTPSTHILLVGDSNQLAPVGHGRPFYDLQQCVPTGHLTEIRRNSGKIVEACAEIRDRRTVSFSPTISLPQDNLVLVECDDESQQEAMEHVITKISYLAEDEFIPSDHLQVVTGKNDGSPVARKPLNKMLQQMFNRDGDSQQGNPFRIGDKIVCLKNGKYADVADESEEHFVANGELGTVIDIRPGRMRIELSDPKRVIQVIHAPVQENEKEVADSEDMQRGAVGDWDLGYCLSVHRSQGSQWKFVIVMADSKAGMVQTRNWLFTAISRAEIATFVIGQRGVVNQMMRRDGISGRKTFLVERIRQQRDIKTIDYDLLFSEV